MIKLNIVYYVLLLFLISCKSSDDKALNKFEQINDSLTLLKVENSNNNFLINEKRFITALKDSLNKADSSGESFIVVEKLIVNSNGEKLWNYMKRVDSFKKNNKDEFLINKDRWLKTYFYQTRTIQAVTILSKFINEIDNLQKKGVN
ncbi:MAG: hypothetical protein C0459_09855 [Chitinophaga sp.]|jgi:hypothetical protein|nr:hypothetical protein [Chitinophaga sp.]